MHATGGGAPELYLVTDRHATAGRPLVDVVAAALAGVLRAAGSGPAPRVAVQLRDKDLEARALVRVARELREVTREAGAALFVNERVDVALAVGADGVHLGWSALPIDDVRAVAPGLAIALSTHELDEVRAAAAKAASFVVFGPVFDTPSKRGLLAPRGLAALAQACAVGVPVVALGGVDARNAGSCVAVGACGVACVRAVLGADDPGAAAAALVTR
jgi:thiamine-phosphate pyrophosphorylase